MTYQDQKNKQAFFALYWGQEIQHYIGHGYANPFFVNSEFQRQIDKSYLLLSSISNITDEDAIEVAILGGDTRGDSEYQSKSGRLLLSIYIKSSSCNVRGERWIEIADFLRSRSYLLPFRGYTIEQILEMGWARIKQD